ncbi:MAG: AI-2E family transporter [Patescibacteria group bacterium]|jgi:predicted PurR-regulated permease PerM
MTPQFQESSITITTATMLKAVAMVVAVWVIYLTADILFLVLAAIFLSAALRPGVDWLQRRHIPRPVSMLGIYAILFAVLSTAVILIVPPIIEELKALALTFPDLYTKFFTWLTSYSPQLAATPATQALQELSRAITSATQGVVGTIAGIFGGLFSFFMVLVMTFYLVVDENAIERSVAALPASAQTYLTGLYGRLEAQIGRWLRAQLLLMALVGLLVYVLLLLLGMRYAVLLAVVAALTEFIPYLGPLIGAVPAILLAYAISPEMAGAVAVAYYLVQLFENNVLTPKIMERAVGLSPIISIVAFLVGGKIGGITGAFLAIPLAIALHVIIQETRARHRAKTSQK